MCPVSLWWGCRWNVGVEPLSKGLHSFLNGAVDACAWNPLDVRSVIIDVPLIFNSSKKCIFVSVKC